ncbi:hypothetical protein GYMLUDRAFT_251305 [Collybiopsis luxurians FD-317 M1]|uniref:DUF6534 domain-containing protein n=1 Tax=Collybiopsis luxurians FD-317 M1 TaxID=944289 RepID=A0A0D0C3H2_9AGAR|nr:hypothetical protein GYMLUDRAFT_251305 [Collybiopsis luxurians FD-317 M1]
MESLGSMNETFGAAYIGITVAALLLGGPLPFFNVLECRISPNWLQYRPSKDVLSFDFIHQALITHTGYVYLVTFYQQSAKLATVVWSLLAEVLFNGLTAFSVQCFLTYRIWKLSGTRIWLTGVVVSFVLAEFACVMAFAIISLVRVKTFEQLAAELKGLSVTVNALAAAGDLLIAGILTLLLQRSKTGFRKSDTMINKLTIFAVNTGALTSLCAVASLISILAAPNTFIYISFFFSMGRLYTNSLLATLNARKAIRRAAEGIHTSTAEEDEDEEDEEEDGDGDGDEDVKGDEEVPGVSLGEGKLDGRGRVKVRCQGGGGGQGRRGARSKLIFHHSKPNLTFSTGTGIGIGTGSGMTRNIDISIQVDTTREYVSDRFSCSKSKTRAKSARASATTGVADELGLDLERRSASGSGSGGSTTDLELDDLKLEDLDLGRGRDVGVDTVNLEHAEEDLTEIDLDEMNGVMMISSGTIESGFVRGDEYGMGRVECTAV